MFSVSGLTLAQFRNVGRLLVRRDIGSLAELKQAFDSDTHVLGREHSLAVVMRQWPVELGSMRIRDAAGSKPETDDTEPVAGFRELVNTFKIRDHDHFDVSQNSPGLSAVEGQVQRYRANGMTLVTQQRSFLAIDRSKLEPAASKPRPEEMYRQLAEILE